MDASVAASAVDDEDPPQIPPSVAGTDTPQEPGTHQPAPATATTGISQAPEVPAAMPAPSLHPEPAPVVIVMPDEPRSSDPALAPDATEPVVEARISSPGHLSGMSMLNHGDIVLGVPVGYAPGPHAPRSRSRGSGKKKKKKRVRSPSANSSVNSSTAASSSLVGSSISVTSMSHMSQPSDEEEDDVEVDGSSHRQWDEGEMASEVIPVPDGGKVLHFSMPWDRCRRLMYCSVIMVVAIGLALGLAVGLTVGRRGSGGTDNVFVPQDPPASPPGMSQTVILGVAVELLTWRLDAARDLFKTLMTQAFDDHPQYGMSFAGFALPNNMATLTNTISGDFRPNFNLQMFKTLRPGENNDNALAVSAYFESLRLREFEFSASYRDEVFNYLIGYVTRMFPERLIASGIQPGANGTLSFRIARYSAQTVFITQWDVPSGDIGGGLTPPGPEERLLHTWSTSEMPCHADSCHTWQLTLNVCPSRPHEPHAVTAMLTVLEYAAESNEPLTMMYDMCGLGYFHDGFEEDMDPFLQVELQPMPNRDMGDVAALPFFDEIRRTIEGCYPPPPQRPRVNGTGGRSDWANSSEPLFSLAMLRRMGSTVLEGVPAYGACPDYDVEFSIVEVDGSILTEKCRVTKNECGVTLNNATLAMGPRCDADCDCGECWRCVRRSCEYQGILLPGATCPTTSTCAFQGGNPEG